MTLLLSRLALLLFTVMLVGVLMVQAQPPDDRAIAPILATEGCTAPCFLGIRPGVTRADAAIQLLESHPWVQTVEVRFTDFRQQANTFWGYVYWDWKPDTPLWMGKPTYRLGGHDSYVRVLDGVIDEIAYSTTLSLGAVVLGLGKESSYAVGGANGYGSPPYPIHQNFYYPDAYLFITSISLCPAVSPDWRRNTIVTLWNADYAASFQDISTGSRISLTAARAQTRQGCG